MTYSVTFGLLLALWSGCTLVGYRKRSKKYFFFLGGGVMYIKSLTVKIKSTLTSGHTHTHWTQTLVSWGKSCFWHLQPPLPNTLTQDNYSVILRGVGAARQAAVFDVGTGGMCERQSCGPALRLKLTLRSQSPLRTITKLTVCCWTACFKCVCVCVSSLTTDHCHLSHRLNMRT